MGKAVIMPKKPMPSAKRLRGTVSQATVVREVETQPFNTPWIRRSSTTAARYGKKA